MSSMPMYFPPDPFNLQDAVICSTLVDTAYDMYAQWIDQGKPHAHKFKWTPNGPTMDYGKPIWGAEKIWFFKHKEPIEL